MKRLLASLTLLSLMAPTSLAYTTDDGCEHPFTDVEAHYAEEAICLLYENDIVDGYSERSFEPSKKITRAEFIKIALENMGYVVTSKSSYGFDDVSPGQWYYKYVTFAHSKGFVEGYDDGGFHPDADISRAEALSILVKITGISNTSTAGITNQFKDVNDNDWYAQIVAVSLEYDLIEGYGDNTFRPNSPITRADSALLSVDFWNEFN